MPQKALRAEFSAKGSRGYRIRVVISKKGAVLWASKGHTAAIYISQEAYVRDGGFHAGFGRLGSIAVEFDARESKSLHRTNNCGTVYLTAFRSGVFLRRIRFRGEQGFTHVSAGRAAGTVGDRTRQQARTCQQGMPVHRQTNTTHTNFDGNRQSSLEAFLTIHGRVVSLSAGKGAVEKIKGFESADTPLGLSAIAKAPVPITAIARELKEGLQVTRLVAAAGAREAFVVDGQEATAILSPPPPFAGIGRFQACPHLRLRGSLKVLFPGLEQSFTGNSVVAQLLPLMSCVR